MGTDFFVFFKVRDDINKGVTIYIFAVSVDVVAVAVAVYACLAVVAAADVEVSLKRTRHAVLLVAVFIISFCERSTLTIQ